MAHYASNLQSSPATAPTSIPPNTAHIQGQGQSQAHGSHLALPDLRSTSPLPPTGSMPAEIELASETQSVSSASGVTYNYPTTTTNTNPFRSGASAPAPVLAPAVTASTKEEEEEGEANPLQRPAWAEEGLGSDELAAQPVPTTTTMSPAEIKNSGASGGLAVPVSASGPTGATADRPESPLPPGAAPAVIGTEPERSGTQ